MTLNSLYVIVSYNKQGMWGGTFCGFYVNYVIRLLATVRVRPVAVLLSIDHKLNLVSSFYSL